MSWLTTWHEISQVDFLFYNLWWKKIKIKLFLFNYIYKQRQGELVGLKKKITKLIYMSHIPLTLHFIIWFIRILKKYKKLWLYLRSVF